MGGGEGRRVQVGKEWWVCEPDHHEAQGAIEIGAGPHWQQPQDHVTFTCRNETDPCQKVSVDVLVSAPSQASDDDLRHAIAEEIDGCEGAEES